LKGHHVPICPPLARNIQDQQKQRLHDAVSGMLGGTMRYHMPPVTPRKQAASRAICMVAGSTIEALDLTVDAQFEFEVTFQKKNIFFVFFSFSRNILFFLKFYIFKVYTF